MLFFFVDL